jgi:hypothetical protein
MLCCKQQEVKIDLHFHNIDREKLDRMRSENESSVEWIMQLSQSVKSMDFGKSEVDFFMMKTFLLMFKSAHSLKISNLSGFILDKSGSGRYQHSNTTV